MQAKNRVRSFSGFSNLTGFTAGLLIILAGCPWLIAADSKQSPVEAVCLKCHNPVAVDLQKKFMHGALEQGCLACHLDCREITPTRNRHNVPSHYLKTEEPGLCLDCHMPSKKDLSAVHSNQLFTEAKCFDQFFDIARKWL